MINYVLRGGSYGEMLANITDEELASITEYAEKAYSTNRTYTSVMIEASSSRKTEKILGLRRDIVRELGRNSFH